MADTTTIRVNKTTKSELWDLKREGDSYDDVVQRLLRQAQLTDQRTEEEDHSAR